MATHTGQSGTTSHSVDDKLKNDSRPKNNVNLKDDENETLEIAADSASIKNDGSLSHSLSSESSMEASDLSDIQQKTSNNNTNNGTNNNTQTERITSHTWRSRMNSFASADEISLYYMKQQEQHMKKKLFRKSSNDVLNQDTHLLDRVPLKKGYLYYLDRKKNKWTLRWFELSGGILMHYYSPDSELIEMVSLEEDPVTLQEHDNAKIPFCFEIITVTDELVLRAESDNEMHSWLNEIVKHRFMSHTKVEEKESSVPTFKSIAVKNENDPISAPNLGPTVKVHTHTLRKASSRNLPPVSDVSEPEKPSRKSTSRIRTSRSEDKKSRSRTSSSATSATSQSDPTSSISKTSSAPPSAHNTTKSKGIFRMMPSLSRNSKSRAVTVSSAPAFKTAASIFQQRNVARSVSDSELANILLNQGPNVRVTWNEVAHKFPRGWKPPKPKDPKPPPPPFPNPNPKYRSRRGTDFSWTSGTSSNENDSSINDSSSVSTDVTDESRNDNVDVPQSKNGQRSLERISSTSSSPAQMQS